MISFCCFSFFFKSVFILSNNKQVSRRLIVMRSPRPLILDSRQPPVSLTHWDGVHMRHVALHGYTHEQAGRMTSSATYSLRTDPCFLPALPTHGAHCTSGHGGPRDRMAPRPGAVSRCRGGGRFQCRTRAVSRTTVPVCESSSSHVSFSSATHMCTVRARA